MLPHNFSYSGVQIQIGQDVDYRQYYGARDLNQGNPGDDPNGDKHNDSPVTDYFTDKPAENDGYIYSIDGPGPLAELEPGTPAGTVERFRGNFSVVGEIQISGKNGAASTWQNISLTRTFWIGLSGFFNAAGTWVPINSTGISGDNKLVLDKHLALTWNLKK